MYGLPQQSEVVRHRVAAGHLGASSSQPRRQERTEHVADPTVPGQAGLQQLVTEDQQFHGRSAVQSQPVVSGRCRTRPSTVGATVVPEGSSGSPAWHSWPRGRM